ncbi:MAG: NeuD/PglB/VioB family sugar acetyltransferase [Alphaproteobacteria bacterium]|nr:NeuD/PglB/VioB family sugar acetyltransferase [Alphaproteobacteria bacterium]
MSSLIIVGAGGFGLEVAAYAQNCIAAGRLSVELKGFLDDTKSVGTLHYGLPVLGGTTTAIDPEALYILALGDPAHRQTLHAKLTANGAKFATLVHPMAYVAPTAQISEGSILAPFSFAGPLTQIGKHVVINIYASVAHETSIGDFTVLSPYAGTHAAATMGETVFLGAHAVITKDVHIGNKAKIAAGAVAYNDIPADVTALGNPARFSSLLKNSKNKINDEQSRLGSRD